MRDVIIVGGGPAGFAAALYSARAKLKTLLLEKAFSGGQMDATAWVANYPGFEQPVNGSELAARMEKHAKKFGAEVRNEEVIELSLDSRVKRVKTRENIYEARSVILCMGTFPRELGLPAEKKFRGQGVSYCATCDGAFYRGVDVAVVGGGDTAAEDALFLTRFCSKAYLVHRRDSLRAARVIQDAVLNNKKIEIVWNSIVEEILGEHEIEGIRVRNVISGETRELAVKGIFVAIGSIPNTGLVRGQVKLNEAGYIVTDECMRTTIPGVFAAGDIREKPLRQIITAESDGAVAAWMADKYISENNS